MRRLWLRWALLIAFVAVLGVAFVSLGNWQLDRLAERKDRNATTIANEQKPVQPYEQVFTHAITRTSGNASRRVAPSTPTISSWCATAAMAASTAMRS